MRQFLRIMAAVVCGAAVSTVSADRGPRVEGVEVRQWGRVAGEQTHLFTVVNANGTVLEMTDFGAKITSLLVPDRNGRLADVVLGFDNLEQYVSPNHSIGATIGRFANRIRGGRFEIDGDSYQLTTNEGRNTLHGAGEFERVVWTGKPVKTGVGPGVRFSYRSPDGSHGFPGALDVNVTMTLSAENAVRVSFDAVTDKPTYVNLTHHGYFNLNGATETIHDHLARVDADRYLVLDEEALPTGRIDELEGKAWDLSSLTRLGDRMELIPRGGYHHNYILSKKDGELAEVAELIDPTSGRMMRVRTTQPSVVLYASMGLTEDLIGKGNIRYRPHLALCIETQHYIDSPNHKHFPSTLLRPGETYNETVIYEFGVVGR